MEAYLEISRTSVLLVSIFTVVGIYTQAIRLWHRRSADDFSAMLVVTLLANELIWLNYGFAIQEWPIIVVGMFNVPPTIVIFVCYFRFRARGRR